MELDAHRMEGPVHVMKDGSDTNVFSVSEMNMYQKKFPFEKHLSLNEIRNDLWDKSLINLKIKSIIAKICKLKWGIPHYCLPRAKLIVTEISKLLIAELGLVS